MSGLCLRSLFPTSFIFEDRFDFLARERRDNLLKFFDFEQCSMDACNSKGNWVEWISERVE